MLTSESDWKEEFTFPVKLGTAGQTPANGDYTGDGKRKIFGVWNQNGGHLVHPDLGVGLDRVSYPASGLHRGRYCTISILTWRSSTWDRQFN